MAKTPTFNAVTNRDANASEINDAIQSVADQFEKVLFRDGETPNNMEADLDLDSNDILNAGLIQADTIILDGDTVYGGKTTAKINADLTINVPTDYDTVQEALDAYAGLPCAQGVEVIINCETGYQLTPTEAEGLNVTNFRITGEDVVHTLDASFDDTKSVFFFKDCNASIVIDICVDAETGARNGIYADNCTGGVTKAGAGVINVGSNGIEPNGCGLLCYASKWVVEDTLHEGTDPAEGETIAAGSFVRGRTYEIVTAGTTDFTTIGAANNNVGTIFTATSSSAAGPDLAVGTGTGTAKEIFYGGRFSGCSERGISATNLSGIKANYVEVINTGSAPDISLGHGAVWASRGSVIHANHVRATGSYRGIRNGRSYVSVRDGNFDYIAGTGSWAFEMGTNTGSRVDFTGTGAAGFSVIYVGGGSPSQPQGGGLVNHERAVFNNCVSTLVEIDTTTGEVNIDDSSGNNLLSEVATVTAGTLSALRANMTADASSTAAHGLLSANAGEIEAVGFRFNGANVVPYTARVTEGGKIVMRSGVITDVATDHLDFGDGDGSIYMSDMTVDGVAGKFSVGVDLRPGADIATRADAVDAVDMGFDSLSPGKTFSVGSETWVIETSATVIPDMVGTAPSGVANFRHWDMNADGVTDDHEIIRQAMQWAISNDRELAADGTYGIGDEIDLTYDGELKWDFRGAVFTALSGFPGSGTKMFNIVGGSQTDGVFNWVGGTYYGGEIPDEGTLSGNDMCNISVATSARQVVLENMRWDLSDGVNPDWRLGGGDTCLNINGENIHLRDITCVGAEDLGIYVTGSSTPGGTRRGRVFARGILGIGCRNGAIQVKRDVDQIDIEYQAIDCVNGGGFGPADTSGGDTFERAVTSGRVSAVTKNCRYPVLMQRGYGIEVSVTSDDLGLYLAADGGTGAGEITSTTAAGILINGCEGCQVSGSISGLNQDNVTALGGGYTPANFIGAQLDQDAAGGATPAQNPTDNVVRLNLHDIPKPVDESAGNRNHVIMHSEGDTVASSLNGTASSISRVGLELMLAANNSGNGAGAAANSLILRDGDGSTATDQPMGAIIAENNDGGSIAEAGRIEARSATAAGQGYWAVMTGARGAAADAFYVLSNKNVELPVAGSGMVLTSPNGTSYTVTVDNAGALVVT